MLVSDLKKVSIVCIAIGFVILIVIAGAVIAWKWRDNSYEKPPSMILLEEEQKRMAKGPLPAIPENSNHYRSLVRQPDPQAFRQHSQTVPRKQLQDMHSDPYGDCADYSTDWGFTSLPWKQQCAPGDRYQDNSEGQGQSVDS